MRSWRIELNRIVSGTIQVVRGIAAHHTSNTLRSSLRRIESHTSGRTQSKRKLAVWSTTRNWCHGLRWCRRFVGCYRNIALLLSIPKEHLNKRFVVGIFTDFFNLLFVATQNGRGYTDGKSCLNLSNALHLGFVFFFLAFQLIQA